MYLSRLTFHTQLGKTRAVEQELRQLMAMVSQVGGLRARVLRNHFASAGAADYLLRLALIEHRARNDVLSRAHMINPGLALMFHGLTFVVPS